MGKIKEFILIILVICVISLMGIVSYRHFYKSNNKIILSDDKISSFINEVNTLYTSAREYVHNFSIDNYKIFSNEEEPIPNVNSELTYCVRFNSNQEPEQINVAEGNYHLSVNNLTTDYIFKDTDVFASTNNYSKNDCIPEDVITFNKDNFKRIISTLYSTAQQQYLLNGGRAIKFGSDDTCNYKIEAPEASSVDYYIELNNLGNPVVFETTDGTYNYKGNNLKGVDEVNIDYELDSFEISKCN